MKLPSKITSYRESVLSKFPLILAALQHSDIGIFALYEVTGKHFKDIEEFMDTLDCLFAIHKIIYDTDLEVLRYVA